MELDGVVQDGVIVPQGECPLPNGTKVRIRADGAPATDEPAIWQKLREIGRKYEQLPCDPPADFAANHDHYIHGTPKSS
jgi:hypothetical protein